MHLERRTNKKKITASWFKWVFFHCSILKIANCLPSSAGFPLSNLSGRHLSRDILAKRGTEHKIFLFFFCWKRLLCHNASFPLFSPIHSVGSTLILSSRRRETLPPMLGPFRHGLLNRCRLFSLFSLSNQT